MSTGAAVKGTTEMIAAMSPDLRPEVFVFASLRDETLADRLAAGAIASFREAEGLSLIVTDDEARSAGLPADLPMRCITLTVHSALDGVGLTAAVAGTLGREGIPCNMVAAFHHDHVFVPAGMAGRAMEVLARLQAEARAGLR
ncbi:MAG: ACT domain-containing protein [Rhodobacteraceae bacterium]|nr:ACT domain-containing protein [Paracoccaceae bacterium]